MPKTRKHAAIMFTDIVGYTSLMGSDEDRAFEVLKKNREIHADFIGKYNGTLIKEMGDGMLISFDLASDAVRCAVQIRKACMAQSIPLKIGIHEGEMVFEGEDVLGDGVNVASRLQDGAKENSINVSGSVYREIKNKPDIQTRFIKDQRFKNVEETIKVYRVLSNEEINKNGLTNSNKQKRNRHKYYIVGALLIFIMFFLFGWIYFPRQIKNVQIEREKSIAVIPFKNLSEDQSNQHFCDGIMEGILNNLSKIEELRVVPRTSVEKYRMNPQQSQLIGKELDVAYLLQGSVFKSNDQIRVTAQLINTEDDGQLWSDQYDRKLEDIFEVMSEVSREVADEIKVMIAPQISDQISAIPTDNLKAYELFLKGKEFYYKGGESEINTSIYFFKEAIKEDQNFALAFSWMGRALNNRVYWSDYFSETLGDTLIYYANKALLLDPNLADGYLLRGIFYHQNGDFYHSNEELENAIILNPNLGEAYFIIGINLNYTSNYADALVNLLKAKKLMIGTAEYPDLLFSLSWAYASCRDYEKYKTICLEAATYNPSKAYFYLALGSRYSGDSDKYKDFVNKICTIDSGQNCMEVLGEFYMDSQKFNKALKYFNNYKELVRFSGDLNTFIRKQHRFAYILDNLGKEEEASKYFSQQIDYCKESIRLHRPYAADGGAYIDLAGIYTYMGKKNEAYKLLYQLEQKKRNISLLYIYSRNDPMYDNIRQDEAFKALLNRIEVHLVKERNKIDSLEREGII